MQLVFVNELLLQLQKQLEKILILFKTEKRMFGSRDNKNQPQNASAALPAQELALTCVIAKGTVIEGKVITSENMRIDGTIRGEVTCDKRLVMDAGGFIKGSISAATAAIRGRIEGKVIIQETLHLLDSSHIKGEIKARQLKVEEGAKYEGQLNVG
jgi:cytoskeletal protein CcmA (bactofilin family)